MAEEELLDTEEEEDFLEEESKAGSRLIAILLWIAGGLGTILLMFLISYFMARKVKSDMYKEEQNVVIAPAPPPLATYKFPKEFRVNTADVDEPHFVQMSLAFGYDLNNKALELELNQRQVQMKHVVNIILGGKKKKDLSTTLQKLNLAEEIKSQINIILSEGKIEEVYFEELVVS